LQVQLTHSQATLRLFICVVSLILSPKRK
jgi:hypothetical protein